MTKCLMTNKGLKPCKSMNAICEPENNARCKGFVRVVMIRFDCNPFKEKFVGVAFRRLAKDSGIFLNFCPFCGKEITPRVKNKTLVW